jgi:aromatic ring-cleaving dioxygenase
MVPGNTTDSLGDKETQQHQQQHTYTLKERNPYDVHVYYDDDDNNTPQRDAAMALREKMRQEFPWMRFYAPKGRPIGPHPVPMWEADFGAYENRDQWSNVRDFLETNTNHGELLSVLIHPHSTDSDYADHTQHAYWVGTPIELLIQGWER